MLPALHARLGFLNLFERKYAVYYGPDDTALQVGVERLHDFAGHDRLLFEGLGPQGRAGDREPFQQQGDEIQFRLRTAGEGDVDDAAFRCRDIEIFLDEVAAGHIVAPIASRARHFSSVPAVV
jgi:hypothetical protein